MGAVAHLQEVRDSISAAVSLDDSLLSAMLAPIDAKIKAITSSIELQNSAAADASEQVTPTSTAWTALSAAVFIRKLSQRQDDACESVIRDFGPARQLQRRQLNA